MKKIFVLVVAVQILGGCAYNSYIDEFSSDSFADIPNFSQVNGYIYRGGRPSTEGVRQLKEKGINTIISLRADDNLTYVEKHFAKQYRIEFVNIPVSDCEKPADNQVLQFLESVTDENKQPLYIHCDLGAVQTTAMIAVYRVVVEGWNAEDAYGEAKKFCLRPSFTPSYLKKFIYGLNDKSQYFEVVNSKSPL